MAGGVVNTYTLYEAGKKLGYNIEERACLARYDRAQRELVTFFNKHSKQTRMSLCDMIFGEVGNLDLYYCLMLRSGTQYMGIDLQVEWVMDEGLGIDCNYTRIGEHIARCVEWAYTADGYPQDTKAAAVGTAELIRTIARAKKLESMFHTTERVSAAAIMGCTA
ncbi:hypothetical protein VSR69_39360 [Paraburkholderia phytofirmans]